MKPIRLSTFAAAGVLLACLGPSTQAAPVQTYDEATLDALDPVREALAACGTTRAQATLQSRLQLARKFAQPASAAAIQLYPDLTGPTLPISTRNALARRYFNQGMMLSYGFNHDGAIRSFREARRLDPGCAMCWWGEAIALGPNINVPMQEAAGQPALVALARAQALAANASPLERALIDAASRRYAPGAVADRAALDGAYADAMIAIARRFPRENDVAALAAEAIMDTTPWNYWAADRRTPVGRSGEAVALIEGVLRRNPRHAQAIHLYIHLMENHADPRRAEAAANRLNAPLTPSNGHLVHMPSHIYYRIGRYADSIRGNIAAARADEAYIARANDRGVVAFGYYPHNVHFIVASAQMAGDMGTAIREARRLTSVLDTATAEQLAWVQAVVAAPFFTMAQVAPPADILAMEAPAQQLGYARAMHHFARAVAYAQLRDTPAFDRELAAMEALRSAPTIPQMVAQGVPAPDLITIAQKVARGRLAYAQGRFNDAVREYREAIALERTIPYQEPPYWYYPVSQSLGAALLRAGRPGEAADAFRAALIQQPLSGWALFGLGEAEAAQGHGLQAAAARRSLRRVWLGDPTWLNLDRL